MRVRVTKLRTVNQPTMVTAVEPELTTPIRVDKTPRWRKRLARLWAKLRPAPAAIEEGWEGTLVEFLRFEGEGRARRPIYNQLPIDVSACVDYDRPMVVLLDGERLQGQRRVWYSSPVQLITSDREGLPIRAETRSSEYLIQWIDKPLT